MADTEDADSDEVIFENTPLYDHLKEIGFDGFESGSHSKSSVPHHQDSGSVIIYRIKKLGGLIYNVLTLPKRIACWCTKAVSFALFHDVQHLDGKLSSDFIGVIIDDKTLIEEDHIFLKNFAEEATPGGISSGYPSCAYRISFSAGLLLGFLIVKQHNPQLTMWRFPEHHFQKSFLFFTAGWLLLSTSQYIFWLYYRKSAMNGIEKLKELIYDMRSVFTMMKKCLRIIQEAEMVSRGFALASLSIPAERLELSSGLPFHTPQRQCAELRESIFLWAKESFLKYRETTLILLDLIPIQKDLDISSHYIARIGLEEFGPLIELKCHSEDEKIKLMAASDNFSLSAIKSVIQLMEVQQSELFKRLGICVLAADPLTEKKYFVVSILWKISWYVENLLMFCKGTLATLQKSYHYYKSLEAVDKHEIEESFQQSQSCRSVLHDVTVAVHSLSLHLRAALMRINDVEEHLDLMEKDAVVTAVHINTLQNLDGVESSMEKVRAEVESSIFCLEESEAQIALLQGKQTSADLEEASYSESLSPEEKLEGSPINIFEIGDPMVEDQVFESITDKHDLVTKYFNEDSLGWPEDKAKLQSEREVSVHLFKELKSVLVVKQEEHRRRECKALGVSNNEDIPEVPSRNDSSISEMSGEPNSNNQNDFTATKELSRKDVVLPLDLKSTAGRDDSVEHMLPESSFSSSNFQHGTDNQTAFRKQTTNSDYATNFVRMVQNPTDNDFTLPSSNLEKDDVDTRQEDSTSPDQENLSFIKFGECKSSFTSSVAALAAERSKCLGLHEQTFIAESFGDDEDDSNESITE